MHAYACIRAHDACIRAHGYACSSYVGVYLSIYTCIKIQPILSLSLSAKTEFLRREENEGGREERRCERERRERRERERERESERESERERENCLKSLRSF
jgi:hypothetical protein